MATEVTDRDYATLKVSTKKIAALEDEITAGAWEKLKLKRGIILE